MLKTLSNTYYVYHISMFWAVKISSAKKIKPGISQAKERYLKLSMGYRLGLSHRQTPQTRLAPPKLPQQLVQLVDVAPFLPDSFESAQKCGNFLPFRWRRSCGMVGVELPRRNRVSRVRAPEHWRRGPRRVRAWARARKTSGTPWISIGPRTGQVPGLEGAVDSV